MTTAERVWLKIGLVASGLVALVVLGLVGLAVAGLFAAESIDMASGCGSVDPTDPANYSEVTIVNDTAREVVVDACVGAYCHPDVLRATLAPGKTFSDEAACGATGAGMTSWRIRLPNG
jgi:hypothetical protein